MNLVHALTIIFIIIGLGTICGKIKIFNASQIEGFEIFLFKIALPCFLFSSILNHNFFSLINISFIYSYVLCFLSISCLAALYFWKKTSSSKLCVNILASGCVNTVIYALPVITFLLGDPKAAILGNIVQVFLFIFFLIILSLLEHHETSILKRVLKTLLNPVVILPITALILSYFQIQPHFIIKNITEHLGNGASSMALFTFGLSISTIKIDKKLLSKDLYFILITKNIVHPIIAFLIGNYLFCLERYWLYALVILTSAPTAFFVYLSAKQFSIEEDLVKIVVALSSVISLITLIFISIFI